MGALGEEKRSCARQQVAAMSHSEKHSVDPPNGEVIKIARFVRFISLSMSSLSNPFAVLLDPVAVLATCANSGALEALPVSAVRSADRPGAAASERLLAHDIAIDALFEEFAAKPAKKRAAR